MSKSSKFEAPDELKLLSGGAGLSGVGVFFHFLEVFFVVDGVIISPNRESVKNFFAKK